MHKRSSTISKKILKAMGLFGGVQALNIICSLIRTKLIAVWIGPMGIGLFGLYNSAIDMIASFSSLGIRNSSVRDIASEKNELQKKKLIIVIRRWSWIVGIFGAVITMALSPLLSKWTFGDYDHIWGFILLSVILLLNAYSKGEEAVLQGTSKLKFLAKGSVIGVAAGVLISIPLFYFWRIEIGRAHV